jgi:hypothetical protein
LDVIIVFGAWPLVAVAQLWIVGAAGKTKGKVPGNVVKKARQAPMNVAHREREL